MERVVKRVTIPKRANQHGEWVVRAYDQHGKRFPEADYFGNDEADAEQTAARMAPLKNLKPQDMKVLVMGGNTWGKGDNLAKALENARKPKQYLVYIVHPATWVDDMGTIVYPKGYEPKEIAWKIKKGAKP